jgi:uncharacterized protein YjbI with pentapeptide repeats
MKIIKPQSLGILHKPYSFLGRQYFVVAAIGFFRLGAENPRFLTESLEWPQLLASLPAGHALDEIMPKQKAEVLLLGSAHSPKPATQLHVQMCVTNAKGAPDIVKNLCVVGDREWQEGLLSRRQVTKPKPFTSMSLDYSRAFGGAGYAINPLGCGGRTGRLSSKRGAMPNISYAPTAANVIWQQSVAAGFGPIAIANTARKQKFGSYNRAWLQQDAPGFARDMDWSIFNLAPPDQWASQFFQGDEQYCLKNLHPKKPLIKGKLPRLQARAFMLQDRQTPAEAQEIKLQMDTVWFLPEHELGVVVVIYHGQTEIRDSDALDVKALMIGYDDPHTPKDSSHYREVMALRLDKASATQHVFNDSQLAADHSPVELARRAEAQTIAETAALAKSQKRLDLLDAQYWTKRGMAPPDGHQPPRAKLPALGLMTAETAIGGDFDLSDIMATAIALVAEALENGKKALAQIQPTPKPPVIAEQQLAAAIERAAVPAYDLLALQATGCDPQLAYQLTEIERKQASGEFTPEQFAAARQAIIKLPGFRRQGRRAAPSVILAVLPLLPEVASQLGAQVLQWQQAGICLAGRDLAGASLVGFDFSGADLREIMLEGADLSDAKFVGANLQGAILTGATLDGADFTSANLYQANLSTSKGKAVCFQQANLSHTHALNACWLNANLQGANLQRLLGIKLNITGSNLASTCADKATLMELVADDTSWQGASLAKTVFLRAHLERSNFSRAHLYKSVLNEARLQASCWENAELDSVQGGGTSNWSHANLSGITAKTCSFHGASFAFANLRNAQTLRCDFGSCDFQSACLDDALFSYGLFLQSTLKQVRAQNTEFFQALCRKADFTGADLRNTRFLQCELTEALGPDGKTQRARSLA